MENNKQIAAKIEETRLVVTSYVYQNMNEDFKWGMCSPNGSKATFITAKGAKVEFTSCGGMDPYVHVGAKSQINGIPFQFNYCSSIFNYGTGTIVAGKYGFVFQNVGDEDKEPTIKPFRKILGKPIFFRAEKAFEMVCPLLEQFSDDMKTIAPDEKTEKYLNQPENTGEEPLVHKHVLKR